MTFHVVFVLFPDLTQLDMTAPAQVLSRLPDAKLHFAAATEAPVVTDCGFDICPTTSFADCVQADLICVPGGAGVAPALNDGQTVPFVARQAPGARYVTSVCTGMFVLGAAGQLAGKRATTHWAYTDLIGTFGARHQAERVVEDGRVVTGGGVTAGLDFALTLVARIGGEELARTVQIGLEYDPSPPFDGRRATAPAGVAALLDARYSKANQRMREAVARHLADHPVSV